MDAREYAALYCVAWNAMPGDEPTLAPSEIDLKLRLGIFRLLNARYRPQFGDQTKFLCAGIFNWALVEPPGNDEAKRFLEANGSLIQREAMNLAADPNLALAFSVLYTFTLILLGPNDPERTMSLADRATELRIAIRSTEDLYPGADAIQFLAFLNEYASKLLGLAL
jgi:hypothetical protein